jgi:hypothetical protein
MTSPSLASDKKQHRTLVEGAIAGVLGGASVAIWLLIIDTIGVRPFQTPALLGTALMGALGWTPVYGAFGAMLVYTVFHFAVFVAVGVAIVALVHAAEREPSLLWGLLALFVMFEVGFYGFVYVLDVSLLGTLAWPQIGIANLLAAFVMGRHLWRSHPTLHGQLEEGLSGRGTS